jgi:RNA polymerase sigma factor (sigma-70 family)
MPAATSGRPPLEEIEALYAALGELRPEDREVIEQMYFDDQAEAQIATALGISQQAVSKRKNRAMVALRAALEKS